jgi:hypothetical protein
MLFIGRFNGWQFQTAISSSLLCLLGRRRDPSRPREARRREALTGGAEPAKWGRRKWQFRCTCLTSSGGGPLLVLCFNAHRDGPDEAEQLAADCGDHLRLVFYLWR